MKILFDRVQSLLSTWLLTIFYSQMSVWHEECGRHDSASHFQARRIGLRYQLLSTGRLISLEECWGLCSQRRVVVLSTIYCKGQHICCWCLYLSYFSCSFWKLVFALVVCPPLFTTGLSWSRCPINCGFGGMCSRANIIRELVWQGVRALGQQFSNHSAERAA